jgi:hypothetical protein
MPYSGVKPTVTPDAFAPPSGRSVGFGGGFRNGVNAALMPAPSGFGTVTAAGGGGAKAVAAAVEGHLGEDDIGPTTLWFEKLHALPRVPIEFGNIITDVTEEYEIYNAFRNTEVTVTSIVNGATPGLETTNVSTPVILPAQTSILDPATTDNTGGTGLGTITKTVLTATQDGLPTFDADVSFVSTENDVAISVTGTRIVLLTQQFEAPAQERLEWLTDVIETTNGKEQRIALRKNPRQAFTVRYRLSDTDLQNFQTILFDWQSALFAVPLWHESQEQTADVSAAGTQLQVQDTASVDLRVGGLVAIIQDSQIYDVATISSMTSTQINLASPLVNSYSAGTQVMPVRIAFISNLVTGTRFRNNLIEYTVAFDVFDNDTGVLSEDTSGFSSYSGKVLFDDCNVANERTPEQHLKRVVRIDNGTGNINQYSFWDRNKKTSQKGFVAHNRAEIMSLRKALLAIRGKQKSFWLPTFHDDLEVTQDLVSGGSTVDINRIDYTRFVNARESKKTIRITFTDGTSLEREIASSATLSGTEERLTLSSTWPANRTVDEITRVQFYELMRFDTDVITLTYDRGGFARTQLPVRVVFDNI